MEPRKKCALQGYVKQIASVHRGTSIAECVYLSLLFKGSETKIDVIFQYSFMSTTKKEK